MSAKTPIQPSLQVFKVKTKTYDSSMDLFQFLIKSIPASLMIDGAIVAITSKIVSISENAFVKKIAKDGSPEQRIEKTELVKKEADRFLGETIFGVSLTVKHGILIPTAGIDESNSKDNQYILFPKDPYKSAHAIWLKLKEHYRLKNLGVVLTDSHTSPLRKGVTGIGLAHAGFKATRDLIGSPDLFGRVMKMTHVNVLDSLSVAAVFEMGETNDSCPIAILHSSGIEYQSESQLKDIQISIEEDLYGNFFI